MWIDILQKVKAAGYDLFVGLHNLYLTTVASTWSASTVIGVRHISFERTFGFFSHILQGIIAPKTDPWTLKMVPMISPDYSRSLSSLAFTSYSALDPM